jgi:hypothetical protein
VGRPGDYHGGRDDCFYPIEGQPGKLLVDTTEISAGTEHHRLEIGLK